MLVSSALLCGADLGPWPRVMRFESDAAAERGRVCYGLVTGEQHGVPTEVLNLGRVESGLCSEDRESPEPVARLRRALALAESIWRSGQIDSSLLEPIDEDELPRRVRPPVPITRAELDAHAKLIIGTGLNYAEHRDEVGARADAADRDDLLLFPKPVSPTGAYAPVALGVRLGSTPPEPVWLMDYEVELAVVLLDDVDLGEPLPSRETLLASMALVAANDVSDREPIFLDSTYGYARAKSHPGYLPLGPWMVHARYIAPLLAARQGRDFRVELRVRESDGRRTLRQRDRTGSMLHGPAAILHALGERYRRGDVLCMPGANGESRYLHDDAGVVPAGSIVLTGTPGGTAVKAPSLLEKLWMMTTAGFSIDRARRNYIEQVRDERRALGYLEPGEQVETWVEHLGRQRWDVVASKASAPYGVAFTGPCVR